jgi:hypothetical protein
MAVLLTVSETMGGAAYNDALSGGGSGVDFGNCINGQFCPIISQPANTGAQELFIRHDAAVDPITDLKFFLQEYGVGTGFTYGGNGASANADWQKILDAGNASASVNANNADGLAGGLHIDMDWQVNAVNQFSAARIGAQHRIFGDNGGYLTGEGRSLATAVQAHQDGMSWNDASVETDASAPVAGTVGKAGSTTYGDQFHAKMRFYLRSDEVDGGILQVEIVAAYSYTA